MLNRPYFAVFFRAKVFLSAGGVCTAIYAMYAIYLTVLKADKSFCIFELCTLLLKCIFKKKLLSFFDRNRRVYRKCQLTASPQSNPISIQYLANVPAAT